MQQHSELIRSRLVSTGRLFCFIVTVLCPSLLYGQAGSDAAVSLRAQTQNMVAIARVEKQRAPRSVLSRLADNGAATGQVVSTFVGAGIIVASDGTIVTCAHVLGNPRKYDYFVCLDKTVFQTQVVEDAGGTGVSSSRTVPAVVMASDAFSDLAVLKAELSGVQAVEYGDVEGLKRGDVVGVVGGTDAIVQDGAATAVWGVISGLKRRAPEESQGPIPLQPSTMHGYGTLLQVDVVGAKAVRAPKPSEQVDDRGVLSTSGGAVFDTQGRLVALMTALVEKPGAEKAAGLAIPADATFQRMVQRMRLGRLPEFGFLGIQPTDLLAFDKELGHDGILVQTVIEGLPGHRAGVRPLDIITQVNAAPISGRDDLFRELSRAGANEDVILFIEKRGRPGEGKPLRVKLGKRPAGADDNSYASAAPQPWRGITVDYISALPGELLGGRLRGDRAQAKIAVTRVEPSSDAWRAGIRPGDAILRVLNSPMESPERFYSFTLSMLGEVEVELVNSEGQKRVVKVVGPM